MVLFRLAEIYRIGIDEVETHFSGEEITRWAYYFAQREREYGKLDHYAIVLTSAVAGITGNHIEVDDIVFDRPEERIYTAAELFGMYQPLGAK